jgi:hypothetical protein
MTVVGYARVSTTDQDLSLQEAALKAWGADIIRAEKRSGTTTEGREELRAVPEHAGHLPSALMGSSCLQSSDNLAGRPGGPPLDCRLPRSSLRQLASSGCTDEAMAHNGRWAA